MHAIDTPFHIYVLLSLYVLFKLAINSIVQYLFNIGGSNTFGNSQKWRKCKGEKHLFEDSTKKCKIALWRNLADQAIRPGDYVEVSDCITNTFRNEVSLSTTSRTTITVSLPLFLYIFITIHYINVAWCPTNL